MAKKKTGKPKREVTRHQLSYWQRQKKRQRIIFGVGIAIIVIVLVVLGAGWYINEYRPRHETAIRVNDTEFDMNYFIERLKFYGAGQTVFYLYGVVDQVEGNIEQNELIRQAAMKLGISVSESEINEELENNGPAVSDTPRDLLETQLLITKLLDEYFEHQVPLSAEQRQVMVMFLESESQASEVRARLEAGEDFAELAGELSLESLSQEKEGDLGWRPKDVLTMLLGTSEASEYIFEAEVGELAQPLHDETRSKNVGYWIAKIEAREEGVEETHVHAILLGSEEEAQQVRSRLEAGEDFAELAIELSQDATSKDSGGDLGWLTPDTVIPALEEFVFGSEVELETLSQPIRDEEKVTKGGYWLVKVLDEDDDREIAEDDRELLKSDALNQWASALWEDPEYEVTSYLDDEKKRWAADKAYEELD